MYDPNRIVLNTRFLLIARTETTDRSGPAPFREVFDMRRYQLTIRPGTKTWKTIYRGKLNRN